MALSRTVKDSCAPLPVMIVSATTVPTASHFYNGLQPAGSRKCLGLVHCRIGTVSQLQAQRPVRSSICFEKSWVGVMRVRLIKKFANRIDGIDLSVHELGDVLDLERFEAQLLIAEGWATVERRRNLSPASRSSASDSCSLRIRSNRRV
jgi:hypothetical protein